MWQAQPLQKVCRDARGSTVYTIEKENVHKQEPGIEMVYINSVSSISNHSTIIANLKASFNKATIVMQYKVDMDSDGNIMLFNLFTKLFPTTAEDQLAAIKDAMKLRTYICTTITQFGRFKVEIENNNK